MRGRVLLGVNVYFGRALLNWWELTRMLAEFHFTGDSLHKCGHNFTQFVAHLLLKYLSNIQVRCLAISCNVLFNSCLSLVAK